MEEKDRLEGEFVSGSLLLCAITLWMQKLIKSSSGTTFCNSFLPFFFLSLCLQSYNRRASFNYPNPLKCKVFSKLIHFHTSRVLSLEPNSECPLKQISTSFGRNWPPFLKVLLNIFCKQFTEGSAQWSWMRLIWRDGTLIRKRSANGQWFRRGWQVALVSNESSSLPL